MASLKKFDVKIDQLSLKFYKNMASCCTVGRHLLTTNLKYKIYSQLEFNRTNFSLW